MRGEHVNGWFLNVVGGATVLAMGAAAVYLGVSWLAARLGG